MLEERVTIDDKEKMALPTGRNYVFCWPIGQFFFLKICLEKIGKNLSWIAFPSKVDNFLIVLQEHFVYK